MTETTKTEITNVERVIKYNTKSPTVIKLSFGDTADDCMEVKINPSISLQEYSQMMNDAVQLVFPYGNYNAFLHSSVLDILKIQYFTDIQEDDADFLFTLSNTTDIIFKIDNVIGIRMVEKIKFDYNEAISYYQNVLIHTSEWDSVAVEISALLNKVNENNDILKKVDVKKIIGAVDKIVANKEETVSKIVELHHNDTK